jgi:hypothetical protein
MRTYALAITAAVVFALPALSSQTLALGSKGAPVEAIEHGRSVGQTVGPTACPELRKACLDRNVSGKQSQSNCKKYREMCGLE